MRHWFKRAGPIRLVLAAAVLVGLTFRIVMIASGPVLTSGDAIGRYIPAALAWSVGDMPPETDYNPGYPLFLAAHFVATGDLRAVPWSQGLLEILIVVLVFKIARVLLDEHAATTSAICALVLPALPYFVPAVVSEILTTFFLTVAVWGLLGAGLTKTPAWLGGFALGAALVLRLDMIATIPLLLVASGFVAHARGSGLRKVFDHHIAAPLLSIALCLLLPTLINWNLGAGLNPFGSGLQQSSLGYAQWLGTWFDDPRLMEGTWYHVLDPRRAAVAIPRACVPSPEEWVRANEALARARLAGRFKDPKTGSESYCGPPMPCFIQALRKEDGVFNDLRNDRVRDHAFKALFFVPLKRVATTWTKYPGYFSGFSRSAGYALWLAFLTLGVLGGVAALRERRLVMVIPGAVILGRSLLPLLTPLGIEPRYILEAVPMVCIFASLGVPRVSAGLSRLLQRIRS